MDQFLSQLNREDLYIIAFLLAALIITIVMVAMFRRGLKAESERPPESLPPSPPRDFLETGARDLTRLPELETIPIEGQTAVEEKLRRLPEEAPEVETIRRPERKPLAEALAGTRQSFMGRIKSLFGGKPALSSDEMEELEEILYTSDLGPQTVQKLLAAVEVKLKSNGAGYEAVREALKREMIEIFHSLPGAVPAEASREEGRHLHLVGQLVGAPELSVEAEESLEGLENLDIWSHKPAVLMVVGVNGAGKTTTIGKLARRLAQSGRRVLVAAGDTFRAAAGDQLKIWTERAQVEIYSPEGVTDPSAVAFKACEAAKSDGFDVVIIDTAGRLHTQKNLMEELKKMKRVISKQMPTAPNEVLLILDANSGQNALIQAREFHQALEVTSVVLTKLDGSAKGGVAVGLAHELKLPIKLIGVGEGIDDLRRFSPEEFVDSIL